MTANAGATVAPDWLAHRRAEYTVTPIKVVVEPIAGGLDLDPQIVIFARLSNDDTFMTQADPARVMESAAGKAQSEQFAHE